MKSSVVLAECTTPGGARLSLHEHDGHHSLRVGGRELMSSRASASEERMAELACEKLGMKADRAVGSILIGGLGLGFTLKRVLDLVDSKAKVRVVELIPEVVAWNREHLRAVHVGHVGHGGHGGHGGQLDDPRVEVLVDDVLAVLARAKARSYDAVLLDVDNGPDAFVDGRNRALYDSPGLHVLSRALRAGGRAVFWSALPDPAFLQRLTRAGFRAEAIGAVAYAQAKRETRTLFVADWDR
jgi:spermidine synthase